MFSMILLAAGCTDEESDASRKLELYLPDTEPIVSVPVYGGTLEHVPDLGGLVAADPEGNRLLRIVGDQVSPIDLGADARPFRVYVEGAHAWVTLRGTGEVVAVDLGALVIDWRTRVCLEPRGIARSPTERLVVVCA